MTVVINDAQIVVQTAIYNALTSNSYISANSIGVFDMVPKGTPTPFITIGDMTVVDNSTAGIGGQVITLQIHSWTQDLSSSRLKTMMANVITALHDQKLTLGAGYNNVNTRFVNSQVFKDPDGLTQHGIQKFRIVVENL